MSTRTVTDRDARTGGWKSEVADRDDGMGGLGITVTVCDDHPERLPLDTTGRVVALELAKGHITARDNILDKLRKDDLHFKQLFAFVDFFA